MEFDIVYPEIPAPIPSANIGFVMLLPTSVPSDIPLDFFIIAVAAVVNSGSAVHTPITKTPIIDPLILKWSEKKMADFSTLSAAKINMVIPISI